MGGALCHVDHPGAMRRSVGDALIVAAIYIAVLGVEGYVVTPLVMGRSLDLNGTTVLIACLFWGFLWGPGRPDAGHADHREPQARIPDMRHLN
ncbi:MAG: AI-2E family transporter [Isosphaeraceae bacterium]